VTLAGDRLGRVYFSDEDPPNPYVGAPSYLDEISDVGSVN
jgi:hypothetical protein